MMEERTSFPPQYGRNLLSYNDGGKEVKSMEERRYNV